MARQYDGCVKIHENCGGVIRWVEALDMPGVGYTGDCIHCPAEHIVVERMIPVERFDVNEVCGMPKEVLEGLEWDHDEDFETNQERLESELSRYA